MTLEAIRRRDPAFDQTRFLARAEAVLGLVLRACAEGRPEQARAVVSRDMALRLQTEADGRPAAGRRQVHDGVRVRAAEVVEAAADEQRDTVAVRFTLEGATYEATVDGAPVAGGEPRRWAEVWWFQRQAGATTSPADDAALDCCPGCGAPVAPTSDGECAYCQHPLADPLAWVLTRVSEAPARPPATFPGGTTESPEPPVAHAASRAARTVGVLALVVVLVVIMGGVGVGVLVASRTTKQVTDAFSSTPSAPASGSVRAEVTTPPAPTTTGFVTSVANPKVRAPVNDVGAAAAAVQARAGRPLLLNDIHLYADGRIIFEVQAVDDPKGADNWVWKGGTVSGPEQSTIGVDPSRLFPLAGLDLSNLARLCDAALGATGIPDGVIESPYLLKITAGLRWYIPVQSEARATTRKTYRVAPDGTRPEVF